MNMNRKRLISSFDAQGLSKLLAMLPEQACPGRDDLDALLASAEVVAAEDIPPGVVTMNATVRLAIESSGKVFSVALVYPQDVDPLGATLSVLAPGAAALLGLAEGERIVWPNSAGGLWRMRIEQVDGPPARADENIRRALLLPVFKWPAAVRRNESTAAH